MTVQGPLTTHIRDLGLRYFSRMLALGSLADIEFDLLALRKGLESLSGDAGVMDEKVFSAILRGDESIPLAVIEPFDGSCLFGHDVLLIFCGSTSEKQKIEVGLPANFVLLTTA